MKYKIIIFDLDGTLLYTLEDLKDSTNYALKAFGHKERTIQEIKSFIGNGVEQLIKRSLNNELKDLNKCLKLFKTHYSKNMYNKTKPYDKIVDILQILRSKNLKIAVVSNKFNQAVIELCNKYFPDIIDIAIGEDEKKGIRKKPHPDSILKILEKMNFQPSEALYVGDSEVDILTASNANIDCASVTWGYKDTLFLQTHNAKIIINTPQELLNYITKQ